MRWFFFVRYVISWGRGCVFLLANNISGQDSSGMINGADIRVDGGFTIR